MPTSGITEYDPPFDDVLQDAVNMVGGGPLLADELISAKRGLNNLLISIQNNNILLHKIETTIIPTSSSVGAYSFDETVLDVLSGSSRQNYTDNLMDRFGFQRWAEIAAKTKVGRPTTYWFDRRREGGILNLWPIPDQEYDIVLTIHKVAEDTVRAFDQIDVPRRFLPAITYGLAYWIGLRRGARVPDTRLQFIKANYEAELKAAMREDRERGPVFIRIGRR